MPGAAPSGVVKIALLVNEVDGTNTWQFIEGAVAEGRSMGFVVDAFAMSADADRKGFARVAEGIAGADYAGLIFVNGEVGFSYDVLRPVADSGMRIVTFEALPFRDGRAIEGLVAAFQDDYSLARLSLETLVAHHSGGGPPRVLRLAARHGTTSLDRHDWEFDDFARQGRIVEAGRAVLRDLSSPRAAAWEATAALLESFPPGSADAFWAPWSELAIGAAEAIAAAGRGDLALFSTGVSNESLRLMHRHRGIWLASAAADHRLAGTVTMRMLAALLAGEEIESPFLFSPRLVMTRDLNRAVNVANLSMMLPGWDGDAGLFDGFQWMGELKAAEGRFLRLSPEGAR